MALCTRTTGGMESSANGIIQIKMRVEWDSRRAKLVGISTGGISVGLIVGVTTYLKGTLLKSSDKLRLCSFCSKHESVLRMWSGTTSNTCSF